MTQQNPDKDTIAAVATAPGRGGIGVIRLSGEKALPIARAICGGKALQPRYAHYSNFFHGDQLVDQGIALFFPGPNSFTGEDVVELQGHGGPVILDQLLKAALELGARQARPGEFSQRAFLNDKIDLTQAEAIADLIEAGSAQAARNAINSLQGVFSEKIESLVENLTQLRIYVEASIDFPEEEIDFLADGKVAADLRALLQQLSAVEAQARQGSLLREGMRVAIAGRPNAGKSSLLNALAGHDAAIVTDIAGTTRDILRETIHIDGMPLQFADTAGLRQAPDKVEQIGIERAWEEIRQADRVLLVVDAQQAHSMDPEAVWPEFTAQLQATERLTLVLNKIDLTDYTAGLQAHTDGVPVIALSAKTGAGLGALKEHLKQCMGYSGAAEGNFSARRRHLEALSRARGFIEAGASQLQASGAGELLAEDLRQAQQALGEITGAVTADELLGRIFGSFCIGK
ncbi:tRNA uridine-5-carboxymethylaminomethyl(34) synthesis GTPase MnmE [Microbulbifer thermotolerans]|uniref:tRNA modification GTPase MnmE n=1 Tax=Microbulbifer thermotolerans TaxID=252514 RepID=A0AB35HWY9_MICTH|nr:tRNA uridine-5-carboxymethylaminomethyl(34) synthesis GTPase MnmE [Microbulbifer thermotolerans]MCX2778517.1 tRNA uridine-5-carboxymethylaminomethyl(34) synthesis GTPase MnmE [Microbulbifer thermotolerans]MCX2801705.1 tRNA uridine-5-carboxymethylaminomethyl(34) synthesis GTPase MnmE [Microbulbifer thermotolerans]MCX2803974.1 tRNA uridine-5-carboxymethylaminomethyl(34) synthesis GTPase MnmE [Microbulbifer thermotolerans]MCX2830802.1 tRNA uridine-5-carboxymethylaminomethyl(34) synthesis GTPase